LGLPVLYSLEHFCLIDSGNLAVFLICDFLAG
jgi:hypothetical protein